jgi:outer membrane protein TolC
VARGKSVRLGACGLILLLGLVLASAASADAPTPPQSDVPALSLADAVREAIASNLDLLSRRQALAASEQEIGLARSVLLPQVDVGARAQLLDSDRSDGARGNTKQKSVLMAAGVSQVLYDEDSWAGFQIQKHVYDGQVQRVESFQLAVIQDAADAFLELDRAGQVLEIQQRNRELTRRNLETSRARIAAGWSSDREILRWESQLAGNDIGVRDAQVLTLQNRFELNRVRNRAPEAPASTLPTTVGEYGFAYGRENIAAAIVDPERDHRMRDVLVRVGLRRSPDLAALEAAIAAADRQLTASRRAFWVPSLTASAGVDHLISGGSGNDFNATEWGVRGIVTFPLFQGGAKFAGLDQSREDLASLRTERSATALSLDQTIRTAFAQASGSFENVGFARRQADAARRNFELVDSSYTLGVASILDLLDAQSQLLGAELSETNARYGFFEDLVAAERAIAFYAFLESPGDVDSLLDQLTRELGLQP